MRGQKAVAYLRVSGRGQVRGDGFARQRQTIAEYAKSRGVDVVGEFRDDGVSGTLELENRAGLATLIDELESNGVRLVLVERADRVARDLMVSEIILGQFRGLGVKVVAADSGTELTVADDDPTRTLVRQVLGAVAEFEKRVLVLKLRAARDRKRARGERAEGPAPYGSLEGEREGLDLIRRLRRRNPRTGKRRSCQEIADELNTRRVPSRSGRPWSRGTVHRILGRGARS